SRRLRHHRGIHATDDARSGLGVRPANRSRCLERAALSQIKEDIPVPSRLTPELFKINRKTQEAPVVLLASQYDQSRYFKAADLATEKKLKIKNVTEEVIGVDKDKERKLVVWFTNDTRGLVLNRVSNRTIRTAYGDAVDGWAGKIIIVFPTMAEFRGKMGPA